MPKAFRFSVQAMDFGDRKALTELAGQAERLGYAELFTADHVGAADPIVPLMIAAEATTRLGLGPLVLNNELHHPVLLTRVLATADRLTGGRLILGIGTGYAQSEHDATGIELREPARRVRRLDESLTVIRALLDTGCSSFSGEHHDVDVADLGVRPAQAHLPFLVGGHGKGVVGVAARHADIFQFTGLTHGEGGAPGPSGFAVEQIRERGHWLSELAAERDQHIERSVLVQATAVGDGAAERTREAVERTGLDPDVIEHTPFLMMGSVEQIVDKIERLRDDVGISHYVVRDAEGFAPVVERLT